MSCCKIISVCLSFAAKCWRCFTNALMTLRHCAFSRQHRTQFSEDVYAFVLWRYVALQIWRVKELFVPGIVASTSSVGRAPDLRSEGCGFESNCGQEFFILYFVASDALLAGRLVPCKWNQAWRPSKVYRCIERDKDNFKSREVNCLKECALALINPNRQNWKQLVCHYSAFFVGPSHCMSSFLSG